MVIVWDKHPIHLRRTVKDFIAQYPRLRVYEFPTSAPELNPTEFVWVQLSEATAGTAPHNGAQFHANVLRGVTRMRRSQRRLWACIYGQHQRANVPTFQLSNFRTFELSNLPTF